MACFFEPASDECQSKKKIVCTIEHLLYHALNKSISDVIGMTNVWVGKDSKAKDCQIVKDSKREIPSPPPLPPSVSVSRHRPQRPHLIQQLSWLVNSNILKPCWSQFPRIMKSDSSSKNIKCKLTAPKPICCIQARLIPMLTLTLRRSMSKPILPTMRSSVLRYGILFFHIGCFLGKAVGLHL